MIAKKLSLKGLSPVIALVHDMKTVTLKQVLPDRDIKGMRISLPSGLCISSKLKEALSALYPEIGLMSEEEDKLLSDPFWILDPIDGTTNLVYDYRQSSISLALYQGGRVVFGIVYNPFTDETFTAELGKGAFLNGNQIQVSAREQKESLVEFGAGSTHKEDADFNFKLACDVFKEVVDLRRICSTALDLCYIAAGRIDGYFEKILKPWDIAAGSLILTEAGGKLPTGRETIRQRSYSDGEQYVLHKFAKKIEQAQIDAADRRQKMICLYGTGWIKHDEGST